MTGDLKVTTLETWIVDATTTPCLKHRREYRGSNDAGDGDGGVRRGGGGSAGGGQAGGVNNGNRRQGDVLILLSRG